MTNPFDLPGPEFLGLYLFLLFLASLLAFVLRYWLSKPGGEPPREAEHLGPYEIAYLIGGESRAVDAALVSLFKRKLIEVDKDKIRLKQAALNAVGVDLFEAEVFDAIGEGSRKVADVRKNAAGETGSMKTLLVDLGLIVSESQANLVRVVTMLPMLMLMIFGAIKLVIGVWDFC